MHRHLEIIAVIIVELGNNMNILLFCFISNDKDTKSELLVEVFIR